MPLPVMKLVFLVLILLAASHVWAAEGDPIAGKTKSYTCKGCHGIPGYNNVYPTYKVPRIGGQNFEYLVAALMAYRAGERQHPTMELQANSLSNQDIQDVSAYFASIGNDG